MGFDLTLRSPKLRFLGSGGGIQLTFDLTGTFTDNGDLSDIDDDVYQVKIWTSLASVRGSLIDPSSKTADFEPASDAEETKVPSNYITLMPRQGDSAQGVCIDFTDPALNVDLVWADPNVKLGVPRPFLDVGQRLKEYLKKSVGLKYYIAGMSNVYDADASSTLLQPRKFCFTCTEGSEKDGSDGTLSIWIMLDKGNMDQAQESSSKTALTFHPASENVHPIPVESTATVIFSHKVFADYFIVRVTSSSLGPIANDEQGAIKEADEYDDLSIKPTANEAGLTVIGRCKQKVFKSMKDFGGFQTGRRIGHLVTLSDLSFDMRATYTSFTFTKDGPHALDISYDSGVQTLSWVDYRLLSSAMDMDDKKVRMRFKHAGKANWVEMNDKKRPNLLRLAFDMPDHFEVTDKDATGRRLIWDVDHAEIPQPYKDVSVPLAKMNFDLKGLDYFLTTNLVLPGTQMFIADQTKPDASKTHGLFFPRDVLLTGKVAESVRKH